MRHQRPAALSCHRLGAARCGLVAGHVARGDQGGPVRERTDRRPHLRHAELPRLHLRRLTGLEPVTHESEDYHAILITGWDENQQAWEIKNSWGTGWGTRGFGKVQYGANLIGHHLLAILAAQDALGREEISSLREAGASPAAPVSGEAAPAE